MRYSTIRLGEACLDIKQLDVYYGQLLEASSLKIRNSAQLRPSNQSITYSKSHNHTVHRAHDHTPTAPRAQKPTSRTLITIPSSLTSKQGTKKSCTLHFPPSIHRSHPSSTFVSPFDKGKKSRHKADRHAKQTMPLPLRNAQARVLMDPPKW